MAKWLRSISDALGFPKADSANTKPAVSPPIRRSKTAVLVIDDDEQLLRTLRDLLFVHGFEVYTAATGAKGLKILIHGPEYLRVVVLDYRMPNFDGADTMRFLHQVRRGVKVIALTTAEDTELPEDFVRGADRIIHKPFHPDHLIAAVRECSTPRN